MIPKAGVRCSIDPGEKTGKWCATGAESAKKSWRDASAAYFEFAPSGPSIFGTQMGEKLAWVSAGHRPDKTSIE
jgi:hypothetical protein